MDSNMSQIVRVGSSTSFSTTGTADTSSHHHTFSSLNSLAKLPSWLQESWLNLYHRHERIGVAAGALSMGMAVMTREMVEMHIQQAPEARALKDYLPVADNSNIRFIGWRQKLQTWPRE
ncbi:hypothetical protein LSUE1_G004671 [Lachnellula suecica]|uniref:Uncharacterized protein n=1 Tax=Lachnellula suecica TaxID=602035 RepID=A0A8T9C4G1_9HELO|nr:hypothetical protein LSUE1_G004671 [Lachnellula suecica]